MIVVASMTVMLSTLASAIIRIMRLVFKHSTISQRILMVQENELTGGIVLNVIPHLFVLLAPWKLRRIRSLVLLLSLVGYARIVSNRIGEIPVLTSQSLIRLR